ncbi:MAG: hypothetical protein OXE50_08895, partial [Chloroflexi bacterium]|nr:hypothetical protein [Chloroflexota bacterium]
GDVMLSEARALARNILSGSIRRNMTSAPFAVAQSLGTLFLVAAPPPPDTTTEPLSEIVG